MWRSISNIEVGCTGTSKFVRVRPSYIRVNLGHIVGLQCPVLRLNRQLPRFSIRSRLHEVLLKRVRLEAQIRCPCIVHETTVLRRCGYEQAAKVVVIAHQIGELAVQARIIELRKAVLSKHAVDPLAHGVGHFFGTSAASSLASLNPRCSAICATNSLCWSGPKTCSSDCGEIMNPPPLRPRLTEVLGAYRCVTT